MNFQNPYLNPYFQQPVPSQVIKVNGENGARSYQMGANSSALLLDESGLIVWLCTTDGAGYKTVAAYDITLHQVTPAQDFTSLESRIKRLEDMMNATADSSATRKSDDGNGKTGQGHARRNAEPTGGIDTDR